MNPTHTKLPRHRNGILLALVGLLFFGLVFEPSAFAKTKHTPSKKSSSSKHVSSKKSSAAKKKGSSSKSKGKKGKKGGKSGTLISYLRPPAKKWPPARNFTTVVVDAGHGGYDRGGIFGQKIPEKPYTIEVARRLATYLRKAGFRVVMTRSDDTFIPLPERTRISNAQKNAVFVSIHFNSAIFSGGHGFETYYYAPTAQPLAARIQRRLMQLIPSTENRGVKFRGYYVLRNNNLPAVLAECGFLTNPWEARIVTQKSFLDRLAKAIAQAVIEQRNS
jgi:N-acetylmuramoyl-L-alanine amidase